MSTKNCRMITIVLFININKESVHVKQQVSIKVGEIWKTVRRGLTAHKLKIWKEKCWNFWNLKSLK